MIDGISIYSKQDEDFNTHPFDEVIQIKTFAPNQYVNINEVCKVGYKIFSSFELKNAEAMLLHCEITDLFAEKPENENFLFEML